MQTEWVEFKGRATKYEGGWKLRPLEDFSASIELDRDDVAVHSDPGKVFVRVGAKATRIHIPDSSLINQEPKEGSPPKCGGKSRCIGGVEFCCSDDVAGACMGYWNFCGSDNKLKDLDVQTFKGAQGHWLPETVGSK